MTRTLRYHPADLLPYVNWAYFFHAWQLPARCAEVADIHECPVCRAAWASRQGAENQAAAAEAIHLYDDAMGLLRHWPPSAGVNARVGLYDARSEGDDILIRNDNGKEMRLPMLRQQSVKCGEPTLCWADFISPYAMAPEDTDDTAHRIGLFVTATDANIERNESDDEYRRMLRQTMADRLAEAAAERLHEFVRRELWGYAPDEHYAPKELFREPFQGSRPAIGYPSLPDQSLIFLIDQVLCLSDIGVTLTENGMMRPRAATAGLLFAHPAARHFKIGQIDEAQLADYAARRGCPAETLRPFLAANLRSRP